LGDRDRDMGGKRFSDQVRKRNIPLKGLLGTSFRKRTKVYPTSEEVASLRSHNEKGAILNFCWQVARGEKRGKVLSATRKKRKGTFV